MAASMKFGNWQRAIDILLQQSKDSGLVKNFEDCQANADRVKFIFDNKVLQGVEWLKVYFKECCSKFHQKSAEKATHHRNEGNKLFQGKKYHQALAAYTQSMQSAPSDQEKDSTSSLALAYGNRSAALFHLNKYQECLTDTERALKAGFPEQSKHKLITRRCLAFIRLCQAEEARKELEILCHLECQARSDVEKSADAIARDIKQVEKELAAVSAKAQSSGSASDKATPSLPTVSYGPNSVLVQASSAVEMKTSPSQGRFLQATQPIKSGDTLIVERPFAAVLLPDHYVTHCHHCFGVLPLHPVGCLCCSSVLFCNEECRDKSWKVYHHVECPYLDLLHSVGIAHLSLRVVLTAELQYLKEFLSSHQKLQGSVPGLTSEGRYERNYLTVYDLMTHEEDMQIGDLFQYSLTAALLLAILVHSGWVFSASRDSHHLSADQEYTTLDWDLKLSMLESFLEGHLFSPLSPTVPSAHLQKPVGKCVELKEGKGGGVKLVENSSENCAQKKVKFEPVSDAELKDVYSIGGVLLRHVEQLVCNAHAITALHVEQIGEGSVVERQSQVRIATAIYPTASLMNHSCDPTIISSFVRDVLVVKSVKDVPAGGEIFNCYGPHCKRMKRAERQSNLKSQYFFDCQCQPCVTGAGDMSVHEALRCPKCSSSVPVQQGEPVCPACHETIDLAAILPQLEKAEQHFTEGIQKLENGKLKDAQTSLQACLTIREKLLGVNHRDLGETHDAMAQCLAMMGSDTKAVDHLSRSLLVTESLYGTDSIEVARELHKMAEVQVNAGQAREALITASRALKLAQIHCSQSDSWVQELVCLKTALTRIVKDGAL